MKNFVWIFSGLSLLMVACDLQPRILSLPDDVGQFISQRYPALLADPNTQPEIYNSAATDYGLYASPDLYGTFNATDEYVMYASVDDYVVPPQVTDDAVDADVTSGTDEADYLTVPTYGGYGTVANVAHDDVLAINKPNAGVQATKRVALREVTVASGDTLYSLSRKYAVPVNDLAVMNNLSAPFNLSVGQKIRVPDLQNAMQPSSVNSKVKQSGVAQSAKKATTTSAPATSAKKTQIAKPKEKISSDPSKKLPKIGARSSSKFSWPVRGKVLSDYGAKSNGLFNDGVNIAAKRGTAVVAAENGVVAYAGNEVKGMGNLIIIQHSDGWMTVYAHLDSMTVRRGAKVNVGQKIGTIGSTGKVDTPQLHFEIRKGTKAYNPSQYLKK
ncbi:MAG: peptidoglycan DD-metalloendopeptidase family protein [Alphaproteobacteria bacterium]|nr:peptidoglycan DD-metalloendopeptidase family protein [Alphaproteobacteria bacterium]